MPPSTAKLTDSAGADRLISALRAAWRSPLSRSLCSTEPIRTRGRRIQTEEPSRGDRLWFIIQFITLLPPTLLYSTFKASLIRDHVGAVPSRPVPGLGRGCYRHPYAQFAHGGTAACGGCPGGHASRRICGLEVKGACVPARHKLARTHGEAAARRERRHSGGAPRA